VVNPQRIIVIPYLANTFAAGAYSQLISPFDSAPSTTCPHAVLTQLNVQVSGQNILNQNLQYDYETFIHEMSETGLNGGKTTGLSSGLIGQLDFQTLYRYYVVNIGRRLPNEDGQPKSIVLTGSNGSSVALDLFIYVEYGRSVAVDVVTGQVMD
jgi:hypothetical protein